MKVNQFLYYSLAAYVGSLVFLVLSMYVPWCLYIAGASLMVVWYFFEKFDRMMRKEVNIDEKVVERVEGSFGMALMLVWWLVYSLIRFQGSTWMLMLAGACFFVVRGYLALKQKD